LQVQHLCIQTAEGRLSDRLKGLAVRADRNHDPVRVVSRRQGPIALRDLTEGLHLSQIEPHLHLVHRPFLRKMEAH
jgi:hypothetical protein